IVERISDGLLGVLKLLNKQDDPERRGRFYREAAALETLRLAGVPRVLDHNADKWRGDEKLFIVMEFIDGPTLEEAVTKNGPFPRLEAVRLTECLLRTLRDAH